MYENKKTIHTFWDTTCQVDVVRKVPTLVIWGKEDTWIPESTGKKFLEKYPEFRYQVMEHAGHCPMETHSEEFNSYVLRLIEEKNVYHPSNSNMP